jgi:homocitrate synthase NifV
MIHLIDNTLTSFDHSLPSKEDLHRFCELLFTIGVDAIELSVPAYRKMEYLPEGQKFILNLEFEDEVHEFPGFYRYVCRHEGNLDKVIFELQLNDAREVIKLRSYQGHTLIRVVGLDDLLCYSEYEKVLEEIMGYLPASTIIFSPENTYGCANALALQWAAYYGKNITTSFAGCKNNAATEEVLMAMRLALRHKPNRDLTVLPQLVWLYERFTGKPISNKKPIIGKHIFQVEAGIHVDGINKNPATYEAYAPSLVGGRFELIIGKHSGSKAIRLKLEEFGVGVTEELTIDKILRRVKSFCTEYRRSLSDEEFMLIVKEVIQHERG